VEDAITGLLGTSTWVPLGTSTRDASTWEGDVLRGDALADLDNDPRVTSFIEEIAREIAPGKAPAYRYAAAISREERPLPRPEFVQWKRRLLRECGVVSRPAVSLAVLPGEVSPHARCLWPLIELLIHVRLLGGTSPHDPLPLTRRFLRRWVPMSEGAVRAAMEELEALEFVMRAGTYPVKGMRPLNLWLVRVRDEHSGASQELPPA